MIKVDGNIECLCGSNKKYGECCKLRIDKYDNKYDGLYKQTLEFCDEKNFSEAINVAKANFINYMIKVKSHTEPNLFNPNKGILKLLEIDIKALSESLDLMLYVIRAGELDFNFDNFLDTAKALFFNGKWYKKIDFYKVLWYFVYLNDEKRAVSYIDENVKVSLVNDSEFLEVIYDVYNGKLSFDEKNIICDKIIGSDSTSMCKVHYVGLKAMNYFDIMDIDTCKELLIEAMNICEKYPPSSENIFDLSRAGLTFSTYGKIFKDNSSLIKAIEYYNSIIPIQRLTCKGSGEILWNLGNCYLDLGDFDKSIELYDLSLASSESPKVFIDKANALIFKSESESAQNILDSIDYDKLDDGEKLDYLIAYSRLVSTFNLEVLEFLISELKKVSFDKGYFREITQQTIIQLLEIKSEIGENVTYEQQRGWLSKLNEILIIQPNFYGLGININKIINSFVRNPK